jgi:hypoxanthine phosphoribosyltransferase
MDLVCIRSGRTIWIEVKREGEEARLKQEKVAREMRANGAEVFLVDDIDDARRILK